MTNMPAVIVPVAGATLQLEERNLPEPTRREVCLRVHACGVCHSDVLTVEGWKRFTLEAGPRSLYMLAGAARSTWEHSIPPVETVRYSTPRPESVVGPSVIARPGH